VTYLAHATNAP